MRLEVTRRAGLAVRALAVLSPPGTRVKAGEMAEVLGTTPGFVPQVAGPLVKAGWVRSIPGPTGGYALTPAAAHVSVLDVVEAIDGPTDSERCVVEGHPCGSAGTPCALHAAWAGARAALIEQLAGQPAVPPGSGQPAVPAVAGQPPISAT